MIVSTLFVSICVVLGLIQGSVADDHSSQPITWEAVFNDKHLQIETLSQVYGIKNLRKDKNDSASVIKKKNTVYRAVEIIEQIKLNSVCHKETGQIFQVMSKDGYSSPSLKSFMAALGYEITARCKATLIKHIQKLEAISTAYLPMMKKIEAAGGFAIDETVQPQHTDLVSIAAELLNRLRISPGDKIDHPKTVVKSIHKMMTACERTFNPIIMSLFETLSTLIQLGFDYNVDGDLLVDHNQGLRTDAALRRWLNIMLACNSVGTHFRYLSKTVMRPLEVPDLQLIIPSPSIADSPALVGKDLSPIKKQVHESKKELDKWLGQIQARLSGGKESLIYKLIPGHNFYIAYNEFLSAKISASHLEL